MFRAPARAIGAIWKSQSARLAALYCLIGGTVATALSVVSGKITPEARSLFVTGYLGGELVYRRRESGELIRHHDIRLLKTSPPPSARGPDTLSRRESPDFVRETFRFDTGTLWHF